MLPRLLGEDQNDYHMRANAQDGTLSFILPRAPTENEVHYRTRLTVASGLPTLVLPKMPGEDEYDWQERMIVLGGQAQAIRDGQDHREERDNLQTEYLEDISGTLGDIYSSQSGYFEQIAEEMERHNHEVETHQDAALNIANEQLDVSQAQAYTQSRNVPPGERPIQKLSYQQLVQAQVGYRARLSKLESMLNTGLVPVETLLNDIDQLKVNLETVDGAMQGHVLREAMRTDNPHMSIYGYSNISEIGQRVRAEQANLPDYRAHINRLLEGGFIDNKTAAWAKRVKDRIISKGTEQIRVRRSMNAQTPWYRRKPFPEK